MKALRSLATVILCSLLFINCSKKEKVFNNLDASFDSLTEEFLKDYFTFRPSVATYHGLHEYDREKRNYSKAALETELSKLKSYEQRLVAMGDSISPKVSYDFKILLSAIRQEIFTMQDLQVYTKNPMTYVDAFSLNAYVQRDYAPLDERVKTIIAVEDQIPDIFNAARTNLNDSLAKPFIETAILIAEGTADFLARDMIEALKDLKDETLKKQFDASNKKAITELKSYAKWLQKERMPKAHNRYSIGKENYEKMLLFNEMLSVSPEEILQIGLEELKKEQALFAEVAKVIDPNKRAIEVFEAQKKYHPTPESLIPDAKKNLEAIRQFLIDKKIITVPSEIRVEVKETPQFARSTRTASMDTPGPFEKTTQAFYFITPTEKNWTNAQKEEWLTQFNYYGTDIMSIHEAYPGHYVQFLHVNASSATKIEKIFGSYAFIEGWAHYTEKMMIEEGFGGNDELTKAKYHLAQLNESLLRLCRLCVSLKMHTEDMSLADATKFFQDNCYYDYKPAYQEALRGTFDPGYLSYTLGKLQILKLREDYKAQEGDNFSLQKFHDTLLESGMPPIQLMREIMLKEPATTSTF